MIGSAISGLSLPRSRLAIGRGDLDQAEGVDQPRRQRLAGDGKVLDGPLRLGAVVRLGGHLDLAHRVFFDAEFAHGGFLWVNVPGAG